MLVPEGIASVYIVDVDGRRQVFLTQYKSATSDEDGAGTAGGPRLEPHRDVDQGSFGGRVSVGRSVGCSQNSLACADAAQFSGTHRLRGVVPTPAA